MPRRLSDIFRTLVIVAALEKLDGGLGIMSSMDISSKLSSRFFVIFHCVIHLDLNFWVEFAKGFI